MQSSSLNAEEICSKARVDAESADCHARHANPSVLFHPSDERRNGRPNADSRVSEGDATLFEEEKMGPGSSAHKGVESSTEDEYDYPDGGLHAWLVVLGSGCALFMTFGLANSSAAFQEVFASDLLSNYPPQTIGWIFSLNLFFTFFGGIYIGMWFDAHGPRLPVALGSIGLIIGMMLLGLCTEYWQFLLDYGVLLGLSGALLMNPAYSSLSHWFKKKRGNAAGVATTAGALGGVVLPLVLRELLPKLGFAWATRVMGFIFVVTGIGANLFLRSRIPPASEGFSLIPEMRPLLKVRFALLTTGAFLMEWGLFVPIAYISSYAVHEGQTQSFGFIAIILLNVGSFFGRWLPGLLSDKLGRFNVMIIAMALCTVSVLAVWLPTGGSQPAIIVFSLLFGFFSGSNLSLLPMALSQLCDVTEYGRHLAACYFVVSFGTLTSVPIGGALLPAAGGDYWGLILFSGLAYVGATACFSAVRIISVGWSPFVWF